MSLDGLRADAQEPRDLLIRVAAHQELEDLALALRQCVAGPELRLLAATQPQMILHEEVLQLGREVDVSLGDRADGAEDFLGRLLYEREPARPRGQRLMNRLVIRARGKQQDARALV